MAEQMCAIFATQYASVLCVHGVRNIASYLLKVATFFDPTATGIWRPDWGDPI